MLKLYFCLISQDCSIEITVHRSLASVHTHWEECEQAKNVGMLHIGFVRPKLSHLEQINQFIGQVLATTSVKWALPSEYKVSKTVVHEVSIGKDSNPCYLVLNKFGYDVIDTDVIYSPKPYLRNAQQDDDLINAALTVLKAAKRPLNKEEIFAEIIEQDLYRFETKKPVSMLAVELNRYESNDIENNAVENLIFGKTRDGRFFYNEYVPNELSGWVLELSQNNPALSKELFFYGIYDEQTYISSRDVLPDPIKNQSDLFRYHFLKKSIETCNPEELLTILPIGVLNLNIDFFGFTVRVLNVFKNQEIDKLVDLKGITNSSMLQWKNFGRGSIKDFCRAIFAYMRTLGEQLEIATEKDRLEESSSLDHRENHIAETSEEYQFKVASAIPLKTHFERVLSKLNERDRKIIEARSGYYGKTMTLQEIAESMDITRERVRQLQNKYVSKIITTEYWHKCIAIKIEQLLIDRTTPLYLERLELEDKWFEGFIGNYEHLASVIEIFSEGQIRISKIHGANIVSRLKKDDWEECVKSLRNSLKEKAEARDLRRADISLMFQATLLNKGAPELVSLLWDEFLELLQFDGEDESSLLIAFGKSVDAAIEAILQQAEKPLHYSEFAERASELLGINVDERRAQNALLQKTGVKLFGRGIYGLEKFNPISPTICNTICQIVVRLMYDGPLMKQWHCGELLLLLKNKVPALTEEMNEYILNIILSQSEELVSLNRMVWARADSNQSVEDRVDMADAFVHILEEHGTPLKGSELKQKLANIRGVSEKLQLQATERMIQLGPDYWGLLDRDVGEASENKALLDILYEHLLNTQRGIHVSEVAKFLEDNDIDLDNVPNSYTLLNLAQRDERFYLAKALFLGLSEWGDDSRRVNVTQAVRQIIKTMKEPMTINEINAKVEDITGLDVDNTVSRLLITEGAFYDSDIKRWKTAEIKREPRQDSTLSHHPHQ